MARPKQANKSSITINIDNNLVEKIEKMSSAMQVSKSQFCENLMNQYIDSYWNFWKIIADPKKLHRLIKAMKLTKGPWEDLQKIEDGIKADPSLIEQINALSDEISDKNKDK